jgi:Divergent InlB B-repeat domain
MPPRDPLASVDVGGYRLGVGDAAGTVIAEGPAPDVTGARALARALEQEEPRTLGEKAQKKVDTAAEVTAFTEEAVDIFKDVAAGDFDLRDVSGRVDLMLDVLQRLDKEGRWEEALRLGRALNGVLALLFRWVDLVRSLRLIRTAADGAGARAAVAWCEHELGTLRLAAGDREGADRHLEEARRIREEIPDRAGLAATEHNLEVLCRQLRRELREQRRPSGRRRLTIALAAVLLLLIGGAAGAALDPDDPDDDDDAAGDLEAELAVEREGEGTVTSAPAGIDCPDRCDGVFARGASVSLTARSAADSIFAGWSGGGCEGTDRCRVLLRRDLTVTATFRAAPAATATLRIQPPANGRVTAAASGIDCPGACEQTFPVDTSVELTATAAEGYVFTGWGEACSGTGVCRLIMSADRTVTAGFDPRPTVEVTVSVSDGVTVQSVPEGIVCGAECVATFPAGDEVTLTADDAEVDWGGACEGIVGLNCALTPEEDASVTAALPEG